jgi:TRAP-type mannitol/chloroaromatic compound transport system permease large subunit
VLYTITCQIAYMTPPFGYNLFLMRAMAPPEIGCATSTVDHSLRRRDDAGAW